MELIMSSLGEAKEKRTCDVAIIGAGPAGLTAAIYAKRSGLDPIVIDKNVVGGLAAEAPFIENYPPFKGIKGEELMQKMKAHASEYATILDMNPIKKIVKDKGLFLLDTERGEVEALAIIFSTGTTHRHLNVKGEKEYYGKGLSYCVTCDGYFFKEKRVVVIGGGNSGAVAALFLKDINAEVTVLEYMERWMCEDAYRRKIEESGITYITNAQVTEIIGDDKVKGVKYVDRKTGQENLIETDGVFIYVGLIPQSDLAKSIGVELGEKGYIKTDNTQRTNVERVYAAGDITGGVAQVIVAAAQGAIAALSAYEDLKLKG